MNKVSLSLLSIGLVASINTIHAQVSFTSANNLIGFPGYASDHPIAIVDIDGDKKDDLVVLDSGKYFNIHFQNASGVPFTWYNHTTQISTSSAWGMCAGDVGEDGNTDILFGGSYDDLHLIGYNSIAGSYINTDLGQSLFLQGVNFADIDHNGTLDIFACHDDGRSLVMLGDGNGNFTQDDNHIDTDLPNGSDNSGNYGSVFTDFDNDGDIDLYVAKCRQGVTDPTDFRRINILFVNDGNGNYTEAAAAAGIDSGEQSWSADFADIDNDGDMDLFIGQHSTASQLFENNGNGTFTDISLSAGVTSPDPAYVIQSVFEDFDNDGWIDLLVTGANEYVFYMNNGDGTFDYSNQPVVGVDINSFALGDLNSDGFTDFFATPYGYGGWTGVGSDSLYLNDGNSNNYLTVTLEGTVSNIGGIGAWVEIFGPWGVQVREIRSGASYGIQNSLNAHFGVGTSSQIDSLHVKWPSGIVDVHYDVNANQFFHVVEGENVLNIQERDKITLSMYPNPTSENLVLNFRNFEEDLDLMIYDSKGSLIKQFNPSVSHEIIHVGSWDSGNYFIELRRKGKLLESHQFVVTD